jgi:hypothetical protein
MAEVRKSEALLQYLPNASATAVTGAVAIFYIVVVAVAIFVDVILFVVCIFILDRLAHRNIMQERTRFLVSAHWIEVVAARSGPELVIELACVDPTSVSQRVSAWSAGRKRLPRVVQKLQRIRYVTLCAIQSHRDSSGREELGESPLVIVALQYPLQLFDAFHPVRNTSVVVVVFVGGFLFFLLAGKVEVGGWGVDEREERRRRRKNGREE